MRGYFGTFFKMILRKFALQNITTNTIVNCSDFDALFLSAVYAAILICAVNAVTAVFFRCFNSHPLQHSTLVHGKKGLDISEVFAYITYYTGMYYMITAEVTYD